MNYNEGQVAIKREPGIDWLKGLAIICVVLGHAIEGAPMYQKTEWLQVLKSAIYTFHMPLFFFLSGCTFAVSAHRNTFRKKSEEICNLLVLYIFWSGVMYIGKSVLPGVATVVYNTGFIHCLLFAPVAPYWYLIVLCLYRAVAIAGGGGGIEKWAAVIFPITALVSGVAPVFFDNGGSREWDYLYRILYHGVFFVGGILFFHNKEWLAMASQKKLLLFLIALPACVLYQDNMQKLPMVKELVAWLMILALISLARVVTDYTRRIKVIEYYGKNSLYIYIIHNYLTVIFRTVYNKFNMAVSPLIYITCNTVVAILICVMVCELAKRFTLINLFFQPIKETKHLRDKLLNQKIKNTAGRCN